MDLEDRVRDTLPVNQPYGGLIAEAYDVWLPPDREYSDVDVYRRAIEDGNGPALELGCGNGRLLLGYARAGLAVEGVDRHEVWNADGALVTTVLRRHRLHWWTREQLEAMLRDAGLTDVRSFGAEDEFVTVGAAQ